ncbi:hypothetical protein COCVIDRAFT_19155 [Bipolaris victoriae FI3]|uniref:AMP-dependent synthetase/ligase domain-containing protein n=1 Tax=Bipolaris victoriae (strain FI3) TaxID=930091 RepID=W7EBC2_BIPV3|nr:hypothetical protein COCVIDRAFT_19155 [Bipolaris victoriae FI3]
MSTTVSDLASPTTLVDIIDYWAVETPSGIGAEFGEQKITYAELRSSSPPTSRALLSAGVRPHDKVPLLTAMSLNMIPAVVGILRVGVCFVPIDLVVWGHSRVEVVLLDFSVLFSLTTICCPGVHLLVLTVNFQKEWLKRQFEDSDEVLARLELIRSHHCDGDLA